MDKNLRMNRHKSIQLRTNLNNHIDENRMMINFIDDSGYDFELIRQQLVDSLALMVEASKLDLEDPINYGSTLYMIIDTMKNKPGFLSSDSNFSWDIYVAYKNAWKRDAKIKSIIDGSLL